MKKIIKRSFCCLFAVLLSMMMFTSISIPAKASATTVNDASWAAGVKNLCASIYGSAYGDWMQYFIFDSKFRAVPSASFPYPNSGAFVSYVNDGRYNVRLSTASKGCYAYARYVTGAMYQTDGGLAHYNYDVNSDFMTWIRSLRPGDHIRVGNYTHSLIFVAYENDGFFVLNTHGDYETNTRVCLDYFSVSGFRASYPNCLSVQGQLWAYRDTGALKTPPGNSGGDETDFAIRFGSISSSDVAETTAHIQADVTVNRKVYEVGAEYSTNSDMSNCGVVNDSNYPAIRDRIWYDFGNGTYPALSKGTQYYYRFYYIENPGEGKHYSETKSFTTSGSSQVTSEYLTYDNVGIVSVEDTSAIVVAEVSTNGDVIKYVAGHGISSDSISWVGIYETSLHRLTWKFDDLQPSTTYYYQYDVFTASGKDYKSNIYTFTTAAAPDAQGPVISDVIINNTSSDGFDVSCRATDNVAMDRVSFAVWSDNETNAQWITGNRNGDTYSCRALTSDHNDYTGHYNIHIYAYDTSGNESMTATAGVDVPARVVEPAMTFNSVSSSSISQNTAHIEANVSINRSCYEVGAEYSTSPDMRNAATINDSGYPGIVDRIYYDFGNGIYPALTSGTTYYYRFYFKEKSDDSRHYSNVFSFTTQKENVDPVDPIEPVEPVDESGVAMYRLYNINSGEHFYTANASEMNNLSSLGWSYEGIGWTAPAKSSVPVYRLYNPNAGDHHYTTNISERNTLISIGWNDEGIGWYSAEKNGVPLYREYNPNAVTGTHNYTTSTSEHYNLVSLGWRDEGIGWYGLAGGNVETQSVRLVDLEPVKHNKYIFYIGDEEAPERLLTDLEGNKYRYDEVMYCDDWLGNENQTEVEYFLNKQYENFTGVLYFPLSAKAFYKRDGWAAQEFRPRFDVYCDDILVYTSPEINDINAGPYSFEINAKDARVLKIKMGGYWNGTGTRNVDFGATLCAANMRLR